VRLTPQQVLVIDALSRRVNEVADERFQEFHQQTQEGFRKLAEMDPKLKEQYAKAGTTIEEAQQHEMDMPFQEGYSGLRSFLLQGLRPQIKEQWVRYNLVPLVDAMQPTWFQHGKFNKLPADLKPAVMQLATFERDEPMLIYREQPRFLDTKAGRTLKCERPVSWSASEKAVMGETTLICSTRYGTNVSILSQYIGEGEVISFSKAGYLVTQVEDRSFMGRRTRRVVRLRDR
jgi:hypothetical protein